MAAVSLALVLCIAALTSSTASQALFPTDEFGQVVLGTDHAPGGLGDLPLHGVHTGNLWTSSEVPKVAIIGAGAGGSSAAYFLSHFSKEVQGENLLTDITVYDSAEYVGGRSTVIWPWNEDPYSRPDEGDEAAEEPVELGASIFVDANRNLMKAAKTFGLELRPHGGEDGGGMSIWDGEDFVYKESEASGWGWWDLAKLFWRYGRSPLRVRSLVQTTVNSFTAYYTSEFTSQYLPFTTLGSFASALNLTAAARTTGSSYFTSHSVSPAFTNEMIAAASTVNYGQYPEDIHGVGALVSLAANGAVSVKGGNRRIFESFVGNSGAKLRLGSAGMVEEIAKIEGADRVRWAVKTSEASHEYDAVVFAAPFHLSSIEVSKSRAASAVPKQPYVRLHVTFIITNATTPRPAYFGLPRKSAKIAKSIFATFSTASHAKPAFNSLHYLKPLAPAMGRKFGDGEWHVVKMFSAQRLRLDVLEDIFGKPNVGKVVRKEWDAYPRLDPILDEADLAHVRLDDGLYYVNGFERVISTMETETVSAFNVVSLMLRDFFGYRVTKSWAEWD